MTLARRARSIVRTPPRELLTAAHVVVVIAVVEALIRWVPLQRLSELFGVRLNLAPVGAPAEQLPLSALSPRARRQVRCTRRVADVWPFAAGPCLRRSLVVGHLLRGQHPALRLGVAGDGDGLLAHAWIEIDDRPLEGIAGYAVFQLPSTGR
jgi:Transglutaminase-like superfamily